MQKRHNGSQRHNETFSFKAPSARSVQLVGDFTRWKERPVSLHKGEEGIWRISVGLEPGTHRYRFLVDGEWREDPECKVRVPNPFGSQDDIREVG